MGVPDKLFVPVSDSQVAPNAPGDTVLMTAFRDSLIHLEQWLGDGYTAAKDHDHDGVNSKGVTVSIPAGSIGQTEIGNNAVGQGELKDALQQSSIAGGTNILFTGGGYTLGWAMSGNSVNGSLYVYNSTSYVWGIRSGSVATKFQARYFTASSPYNLGNGDIPIFCFAMIDNNTGNIIGIDVAEAPPWFYNGRPENTFDPKKYKKKKGKKNYFYDRPLPLPDKSVDFEAYLAAIANPQYEEIEITPAMKNLDMDIIPHPFIGNDLTGKSVVLLDPVGSMAEKMRDLHDMGESVADLLHDGYLLIGNEDTGAISPVGVKTHKVKWK